MKKRYRYITSSYVNRASRVSLFRLIGINQIYGMSDALRIEIPEDLKLEKLSCDGYSTTEDERPLAELNPAVVIRVNGDTVVDKELTNMFLNGELEDMNIRQILFKRGYYGVLRLGYITSEQMDWWNKHVDKHWQIWELPKNLDEVEFYSEEYITEHFEKYLNIIKDVINSNVEYKEAFKEYSNTELMDIYGNCCLKHCCDTKLDIEGMEVFLKEDLDDELRWIKRLRR